MQGYRRYAVYWMPEPGALADFGAAWLGWDPVRGQESPPAYPDAVAAPRFYGLHATLKPPFRLAEGVGAVDLVGAVDALAARQGPVALRALAPADLHGFLCLTPEGPTERLGDLAAACVRDLDALRAPLTGAEVTRRRAAGLDAVEDALLVQWGYPHVMERFRFHVTLTGRLDEATRDAVRAEVARRLPALPRPFGIDALTLAGEDAQGRFHVVHRAALTG